MEVCELMSASFFQSGIYDGATELGGYPYTDEPICVLGYQYIWPEDQEQLEEDVRSKILFTYRKGFSAIGGTGPTSDAGWGCTLRCGQMMVAQALINRHLKRSWRWHADKPDPSYSQILRMFQDKKDGCYSIHQIASMGVCEGKEVGEWFGPNTVAQVLRKLAAYDSWSGLVVHIAMDNTVVTDDIRELCTVGHIANDNIPPQCKSSDKASPSSSSSSSNAVPAPHPSVADRLGNGLSPAGLPDFVTKNGGETGRVSGDHQSSCNGSIPAPRPWRPLLLIIPLRLGLSEINPVYFDAIKACLSLRQSTGVIGGKPSHAHWFIGFTGDKLMYLDPHTCQPYVDLARPDSSDESFHCNSPWWMDITQLDPSVAVSFYCDTEAEFDDWLSLVQKHVIGDSRSAAFEVRTKSVGHFSATRSYDTTQGATGGAACADFTLLDDYNARLMDSDDEFEII